MKKQRVMDLFHVCVLQSGKTRDSYMAAYARNIWLWSASYVIDFQFVHIAGKTNVIADLLSRWTQCYMVWFPIPNGNMCHCVTLTLIMIFNYAILCCRLLQN